MSPTPSGASQPPHEHEYPAGALEHLAGADPVIGGLIERYGVVVRDRGRPPFYALVAAIVGQQISVKAAAAILGRLGDLLPDRRSFGAEALAAIPLEQLRAAGLSAAKASYMHDLAAKVAGGQVDLARLPRLSDEEVIAALVQVKGIGRWTAEMFLIFSLGRLDVLPVDDLGLRKAVMGLYGLSHMPKRPDLEDLAGPWQPYRTVATLYLWRSLSPQAGLTQTT